MSGCTSTAIASSVAPARARESRTCFTATAKASNPWIPMTESNWPAIDDSDVSSTTDELRATRSCSSPFMLLERFPHRGMGRGVGAFVDGIGEGRRQDDTRQRVEPADRGARERGRLPAGQRRVARSTLAEVDNERTGRIHIFTMEAMTRIAQPIADWPVRFGNGWSQCGPSALGRGRCEVGHHERPLEPTVVAVETGGEGAPGVDRRVVVDDEEVTGFEDERRWRASAPSGRAPRTRTARRGRCRS